MGQKRSFYQTQIKIGKQPEQLDSTITAITAAMPPVATDDNHGLETGDVVFLQSDYHGANGFFTIKKQGDNAFELVGQDFRGAGQISAVKYKKVEMSGFCDATGIDVEPATISFSEVTTNCDNYPIVKKFNNSYTMRTTAQYHSHAIYYAAILSKPIPSQSD